MTCVRAKSGNADSDVLLRIVRAFVANPHQSRRSLAKAANVSLATLQRRLKELRESGELFYQLALSPKNRFFPLQTIIGFDLDPVGLEKGEKYGYDNQDTFCHFLLTKAKDYPNFAPVMKNIFLERVALCFGHPTDVVVIASATDSKALAAFVTQMLRRLPGVGRTNAATILSFDLDESGPEDLKVKKVNGKKID